MEDAEIAWAAGLYEGEGSTCIFEQKHNVLPLIRIGIEMTDRDVLERFCRIVSSGHVTGPHSLRGRPHHKPTYRWMVGNRPEVERILNLFLPWLGVRRAARAREALAEIAKLDRICRLCSAPFRARRSDTFFCCAAHRSRWNYLQNRLPEVSGRVGRPRSLVVT